MPQVQDIQYKGVFNGFCYRSDCDNPNAVYFNHATKRYYCSSCAKKINDVNADWAQSALGHHLCVKVEPSKTTMR